ncbi:hypothetical protein PVAND_013522 [Polypedilum vanderplanki]|uniref:Glutamate receptor ionotropic, kainate 2-like n=1 Tax=Polypedilum vanderplanki TaxID=319348 RepID=A0A9J6CRN4_POLVA|nr:hypothetical protein PVAND_013522 [Polypedilum vanderplanki]
MKKIVLIIFIIFVVFVEKSHLRLQSSYHHQYEENEPIKIGGLFEIEDNDENEEMFRLAVLKTENENNLPMRKLIADFKRINTEDEFSAAKTVCKMIANGALGIIGPSSPDSSMHVRNICDTKEIPLIETQIGYTAKHVINLHPTPESLSKVFIDLINAWEWQSFTVLYENAPWLAIADHLLRNYSGRIPVAVRQLDVTMNNNYRPRLLQVKQSEEKNIILCCSIDSLEEILKQSLQVGLLSDEHNVLITTPDMHTIDLESYQYSGTNITGVRMVNPENPEVFHIIKELYHLAEHDKRQKSTDEEMLEELNKMKLSTALIYDAVMLYSLTMYNKSKPEQSIDCNDPESIYNHGLSIFNTMKTITPFKGLSGEIQFDQLGNRENFHLEVIELVSDGLKKIGTWNSTVGLNIHLDRFATIPTETDPFKSKVLKILIVVENPPYAMRKETTSQLKGNDQFEGHNIELIEKLAARLGFNYTFEIQEDRKYGNRQSDGSWDGMIGELQADRADIAITDLTITSERVEAADFTMPFMDLGIQIVFQKPKKEDPDLFSFLQPFSAGVWAGVIGSFFLVSFSLFIMGRMSPSEWDNPFPCIEEPEVLLNQFTLKNAIWFSVGAVLQQGSEIAPKAPSTRLVASIWWFFTLIMVSSYTANLAAFLTTENPSPIIENIHDLVELGRNGKITYGAKRGGSTFFFFRDSSQDIYKEMYQYMLTNDHLMTDSNDAGFEKARVSKYAFLAESSTIEYNERRICDIAHVGDKLDAKGYGIAVKKGSPLRGPLEQAILHMQESGELTRLKSKWWEEKRGGGTCSSDDSPGSADKLSMKNVGGIFVTVIIGSAFAIILGLVRWIRNIRSISKKFDMSFKDAFKQEFRFFKQFNVHVKTVRRKSSSSQLDSADESNESQSRGRSRSYGPSNNNENIRLSSKSLNKSLKSFKSNNKNNVNTINRIDSENDDLI